MLCYTFSLYYVFSLHVSSYVDELSRTHETGTTVHSLCEDFPPYNKYSIVLYMGVL